MKRLENKVAIITGGASGIGAVTAQTFLEEGANVIIWDVDEKKANVLTDNNARCHFQKTDVSDAKDVERALQVAIKHHQKIDILVNNAGITRDASLFKMDESQFDQVIKINLKGVFITTKSVAAEMVKEGSGVIINTSSVVALYGNFGQTNYVASKAGIIGMTKVWARELGRKGVRVNAVAPGFIATEMIKTVPEKVISMLEEKTPLGRLGRPEDIANAYLFLASDEASFINGATLSVDGGLIS